MNTCDLLTVDLRAEAHIVTARRRARDIASLLGFEKQDCTRIATTVSEIARNAWRYAGGGRVEFRITRETDNDILDVTIRDQGQGITNLNEILDGRYKSSTGMGLGLLSGRRLMDRFNVNTCAQGTVVRLGKVLPRRFADPLPIVAGRITDGLLKLRTADAASEIEEQNRELLQTLASLEKNQAELSQLNRELEETNRGVVALYAELDDRAQEIQKIVDLKSRFLSNITHEFRTPLNSIISLSRMLLERIDGELSTEQEKQTRFINRAARDLGDLVNDLLDLAKADAGKVETTLTKVSVNEIFATLRGMLRPLIEHNSNVLLTFDAPSPDVEIISDERKLSQILRNLISNALKYTPIGEVRVSAHLEGNIIVFTVSDTGIGIPEEHQDKIFEEFYQVRNPLQQKTKGTGLGLALSRRLIDLLHGTITFVSTVGKGTTFTVKLPLTSGVTLPESPDAEPPGIPKLNTAPAVAETTTERDVTRLVLFVDERVDSLFAYEHMLEHTSFKAILARDANEALNILKRVSVSAIVTPSAALAQNLANALPPSPEMLPRFVVLGDARENTDTSGYVDAFISDPPNAAELVTSLQTLTNRPRLTALVIDDSADARAALRVILEEFQLSVVEAGSAAAALASISEHNPNLIFTDILLPDGTGIPLITSLKRALENGTLIIHSSQVFSDEDRETLKQSAFALIRKGPPSDSGYRTAIIHELARAQRRHHRA